MQKQIYPFLFLLLFYFLAFFLRSFLLWKNTGINPIVFDKTDDAHGFNGKLFKVITTVEFFIVGIYSFGKGWYTYLLPFWYLEYSSLYLVGWILLGISLVWVIIAQIQMADSWRIGIDQQNQTDLVTSGLFSISRNPIFLGIILADLGLFLIMPNAFTLLILVLTYTVIQTQVRLEETFLREVHAEVYMQYCIKVRRWF